MKRQVCRAALVMKTAMTKQTVWLRSSSSGRERPLLLPSQEEY